MDISRTVHLPVKVHRGTPSAPLSTTPPPCTSTCRTRHDTASYRAGLGWAGAGRCDLIVCLVAWPGHPPAGACRPKLDSRHAIAGSTQSATWIASAKKESPEPDDVEHSADGHSAADCITELHVTSTGAKASGPAEIWFGKKRGAKRAASCRSAGAMT